jgi:hypothetical protein
MAMATLTETIYEKLMAAAGDPMAIKDVFQEFNSSKGPFFGALGKARGLLQEQVKNITQKCQDADNYYQERQQQIKIADQNLSTINHLIEEKKKEETTLDSRITAKKELLDEAKAITEFGFGTKELAQLHQFLSKIAAYEGVKTTTAAALFFNLVSNYQYLISLELEVKSAKVAVDKAKTEVEYWQAEAKTAEAKSKLRKASIDFAEKLIANGIKPSEMLRWDRIIFHGGAKPEKMADALKEYISLDNLCQHRRQQAEKLEEKIKERTNHLKTLTDKQDEISDAIGTLRKQGLVEITRISEEALYKVDAMATKMQEIITSQQQTATKTVGSVCESTLSAVQSSSQKVMENIQSLMNQAAKYSVLERQAGELSQELVVARALKSQDPEFWKKLSFHSVREMLSGIILWSKAALEHNPSLLPPPYPLSSKIQPYFGKSPVLEEVLSWASASVYSETERKAVTVGYILLPRP